MMFHRPCKPLFFVLLSISGLLCASPIDRGTDSDILLAGTAQVDITPPEGYRMSGYFHERCNQGTHDPLLAKILFFRQGKTEIALVFCDIIGIAPALSASTRKAAEAKTGIPGNNILIAATHSHTGPLYFGALRDYFHRQAVARHGRDPCEAIDYLAWLREKLVAGIQKAKSVSSPAAFGSAVTQARNLTFNRRFHMKDGGVRFNPGKGNPDIVKVAGPVDPDVSVLLFRQQGKPVASLTSFALHLDTVGGIQYSADYPVYLSRTLCKHFGQEFLSVFGTGTCGDLNHIDVSHKRPQKGHEEARRIGERLGEAVKQALTKEKRETPWLGAAMETVKAPLQTFTREALAQAQKDFKLIGTGKLPFLKQVEAYKVCAIKARQSSHIPLMVQVFRLSADVAIVGLPGEVFVDLGLAIKKQSPFRTTLVIELCNDTPGYIPTRKAFKEGSYETVNSRVQPGEGERMAAAAVRLLKKLKVKGS